MVTIIKRGMKKKEIHSLISTKKSGKKHLDIKKYCGTIRLKEDPIEIQKKSRDEWK